MKISVIIPAFNEEKLIAGTLGSIRAAAAAFTQLEWETELVVCDNNSTDHTGDLAREAGAKVVFEPLNQIGRARNAGAAGATGNWFIFVDADSHPSAALFADVAQAMKSGDCLAGGSTVVLDHPYRVATLVTGFWNLLSRVMRWGAGSFIFCDAAAFREAGGFSNELYASEEIDLFKRLKRLARVRGKRITILHRHPLVTSARKMHLYTPWEHLRFLMKTVLQGGRSLKSREACPIWYDGRR
jgi:glycosyltransferase involved in cell wall biosynthesis